MICFNINTMLLQLECWGITKTLHSLQEVVGMQVSCKLSQLQSVICCRIVGNSGRLFRCCSERWTLCGGDNVKLYEKIKFLQSYPGTVNVV